MNSKLVTETSKFLSYVLRHEPQAIGLALDTEGWASIDALIAAAAQHGRKLDRALIENVVSTNDKKRFTLSPDGKQIRAVQGHSTAAVAITFEKKVPPAMLYHGTAQRFMESIRQQGLKPGERQYVHLSENTQTATTVGQRHGKAVVLGVAAAVMHQQGLAFYQAENGVWLTASVAPEFLDFEI
ncbi:MAG: RNA 2'-phosphotransferase [Pseudomonadota bacterium]